jgi:hypothetical protein
MCVNAHNGEIKMGYRRGFFGRGYGFGYGRGFGRGYGRGLGWGYGLGYGRGYGYSGDPTRCARFPWLQRWWWANPDNQGTYPYPTAPTGDSERGYLEEQMKMLESDLVNIKKRLAEIAEEKTV